MRNAAKGPKKRVQVGPSDVEKEKAATRGEEAPKGPSKKQQKYYSYDYFKEWDKFDVDKEIERIEEEEKKQTEYRSFSKKSADFESPEEVHDPLTTYKIDEMTPLEKRVAAKREKEKGNECMKAAETNAAVGFYSKALELVPGDHLVLGNRAQAYIGIKCYYQAELDCDLALSIEPSYAKARYRRAVAREEQGKLEEAKEDYDELLKEQPDHTLGQQKRAVLEVKLRKKRAAEEAKRKEEEERRRYDSAPRKKIQIQELDDEEDDDGMDAEALKKAREAVKQKQEDKTPPRSNGSRFTDVTNELTNTESDEAKSRRLKSSAETNILKLQAARKEKELGNNCFKAKDLAGAVRHYSRGLDLLPADDSEERHLILCNRALVLLQQDKTAEAESDCSEAIKANATWGKAWHRRGIAKAKVGRLDEALEDLEQALKLEPNSKSTIDEIKNVRNKQLAQSRTPAAGKMRVQIEEVETDSEDDDVVVINSPGSKNKPGPQGDKDTDSSPQNGPGAAAKKVQIIEEDDDSDNEMLQVGRGAASEGEGEVMDDEEAVSVAPSGARSSGGSKPVAIEEVSDDEDEAHQPAAESKNASMPPEAPGAGKAAKKVAIEEVDSEEEEGELMEDSASVSKAPSAAVGKMSVAAASPKIVLIEEDDSDEDEPEKASAAPAELPPAAVVAKRTAWEETPDVDVAKVRAAKKIKEEADNAFKNAMFEKGAALYSKALEALGCDEDTAPEQTVCCLNRAACNLQVREYGQVIADCGQVLDWDPENVKAYLRRGLAYEGSGRFNKAAADMREALSIEFASGGLTALGTKAKECLERCKKAEPDLRAIPIPTRVRITPPAHRPAPVKQECATASVAVNSVGAERLGASGKNFIAADAFSGSTPGYVFKKGDLGLGYYKDPAAGAKVAAGGEEEEDIRIIMDQTGVDRARAAAALNEHKEAAGAILAIEDEKEGKPPAAAAAASKAAAEAAEKPPPSAAEKLKAAHCAEAEDHKNKGNLAFKAGKYRSAIMHYSAAIDLDDANATYYTNLAAAHNVLKDYENGLKMAIAARKADPKYVKGIYRHAQALQGLGKLREALAAYEEGLALMPDSAQMAEGRTQVCKAIRDSESSELNAIAKLKALKEQEEKQKAAHAQQPPAATKSVAAPPIAAAGVGGAPQGPVGAAGASESGPKSGAEIKKALRNMRKDMVGLFQMMVQCAPAQLPKLLKSGLEEEELVPIIRSLAEHGVAAAPQQSFELLRGLADVPRVAIVLAMLDRKDTKMLEALLLRLHPSKASEAGLVTYDVEAWANLRKALGV